ncbi:MAG: putative DNA-binding domain-containing protein [Rhodospirillales bacterium]|nr:putative DNA-binding domain-containing protein [Rhodospirillales bacterium]
MNTLHDFQAGFVNALWAGGGALPEDDFVPGGVPVAVGLAVYRNNVFAQLTEVLSDLYPVVKMLVGDEFFAHTAKEFIRSHPPHSPVLAEYGGDFPEFMDGFVPAESVPYLGGVARLELARYQALSAPDAEPLAAEALKDIPPERLGQVQFKFHPSVRLLRSIFPVEDIWNAHQNGGEPDGTLDISARDTCCLVFRPEYEVETRVLSFEAFEFVSRLFGGETLALAFAATSGEWDPQQTLTDLLVFGVFTEFHLTEEHAP